MIKDEYDRTYNLSRTLLGLTFIVFGINGLFDLVMLPMPEIEGYRFIKAIEETGYIFPFLSVLQIVCGMLLFIERYVILAITLLAPVVLNILAFHIILAPSGLPIAFIVAATELSLLWHYRKAYGNLFFGG